MEKVLGIDFGDRKVGIAIGYTESNMAMPRELIRYKDIDVLVMGLKEIVEKEKISTIIVGLPRSLKNTETEQTSKTKIFIKKFKNQVNVPIIEIDERLSSVQAQRYTEEKTTFQEDSIAAKILVETYLDSLK